MVLPGRDMQREEVRLGGSGMGIRVPYRLPISQSLQEGNKGDVRRAVFREGRAGQGLAVHRDGERRGVGCPGREQKRGQKG